MSNNLKWTSFDNVLDEKWNQSTIINLVKSYDGVVTSREVDTNRHVFTVDYNDLSLLGYWGGGENWSIARYAKATFSAALKPIGYGDTLMTIRWHRYKGIPVFRHHRKLYEELKLNNKQIVSYKKYKKHAPKSRKNRTEYKYRSL